MSYNFIAPKRAVSRVFLHCSDSDIPAHDDVSVIREWHLKRRFDDVGYQLFIRKSGDVQEGRSMEVKPAAQAGNNAGTIAICLSGRLKFTEAQFETLRILCHQIQAELPMVTFHGHREVNPGKTCPNFDYRKVLGLTVRGELT